MLGAIEAGGTKFVCAVGDETGKIIERIQIPTTVPEETMPKVIEFFKNYELKAIGVGSFGPIDVNRESARIRLYHLDTETRMAELSDCKDVRERIRDSDWIQYRCECSGIRRGYLRGSKGIG